ncbi:MAG TPA: 5-formyltetrahydrofolate cyclo-ligase [Verrucomicrobiae bacterium]|jgi:5-formyltetrahydrofolate cyclo-ligase
MISPPSHLKAELRKQISANLKKLSPGQREIDSQKICARLKEHIVFQEAQSVLLFAPLAQEVDIWPLVEEAVNSSKVVALPCFDADRGVYQSRRVKNLPVEILSGQFGIREPSIACLEMPLDDLDLVLVPGVAFDLQGNRLGRGKGFYDRLLENFRGKKIGIAFDEQMVDAVPAGKLDVRMDLVLTPTRGVKIA